MVSNSFVSFIETSQSSLLPPFVHFVFFTRTCKTKEIEIRYIFSLLSPDKFSSSAWESWK
jgi:hypothetical protein